MDQIIEFAVKMAEKFPILGLILTAFATLVALATVVIALTPTKKDDEALERAKANPAIASVFALVERFSLIKKNPNPAIPVGSKEEPKA